MKVTISQLGVLMLVMGFIQSVHAAQTDAVLGGGVCLNEVLIDPNSSSSSFDTDGNGIADTTDEFVELFNLASSPIEISGWQLWDAGNGDWYTFPPGTVLGPGNLAVVVVGVQSGGSLPALSDGDLAFDAGRGAGVINNASDNVVLLDPGAGRYIQLVYNSDIADDPPADYSGFPGGAVRTGPIEDWGSDVDGVSLTRNPSGDTGVVVHNTVAGKNASPGTHASSVPAGYYDPAIGRTGAALRAALHGIIDDHTRFPYTADTTDTWDILESADELPGDAASILDLYRNAAFTKAGGDNDYYNREHTWPKAYGFPVNLVSNYPYTDCHALFLCDSGYNSSRSNNPYRTCDPYCTEKPTLVNDGAGGGAGVYPGNSSWRTGAGSTGIWETWIGRRGDVARALFYLDIRYEGGTHGGTGHPEPDLVLTDDPDLIQTTGGVNTSVAYMGALSVLLEWHAQDPVDEKERRRNDIIFTYQGNRNPFIDHPEWVWSAIEVPVFSDGFESGDTASWSATVP